MAANEELIDKWNKVFHFKIKESDLTKPTQEMLTEALESYITEIHINIDQTKNVLMHKQGCYILNAKFCEYIDYLYKISNKSNNFFYVDLINPQPKKTVHLLNTLSNFYLYYYENTEKVVETTNTEINKRESLLQNKNEFIIANEKAKNRIIAIDHKSEELHSEVKYLREKIPEINKNKEDFPAKLNNLDRDIYNSNDKIDKLISQKVCENEYERFISESAEFTLQLKELDETKHSLIIAQQDLEKKRNCLENCFIQMNLIPNCGILIFFKNYENEIQMQSKMLIYNINKLNKTNANMKIQMDKIEKLIITFKQDLAKKTGEFNTENLNLNLKNEERLEKHQLNEIQNADKIINDSSEAIKDLFFIQEFLINEGINILNVIKHKLHCNVIYTN